MTLRGWTVLSLLFLIQVVNYADKSVMGLAATDVMAELGLSKADYGIIASGFFLLFAVSGLGVAILIAPRIRPRIIITVMLALWSLAQLPVLLAPTFAVLLGSRILLGAGEGPGTTTSLNAAYEWFPESLRTLPGAVLIFGSTVGSMVAAPVLSHLMGAYGWRAGFAFCSTLGAAVLGLWMLLARDGPDDGRRLADKGPVGSTVIGAWRLWREPTVLGSFVVGACSFWIVGFSVAWLPTYVTDALGVERLAAGWVLSGMYLAQGVIILLVSTLSDVLVRRGGSVRLARGVLNAVCMFVGSLAFLGVALTRSSDLAIILMAVAVGSSGLTFTLSPALLAGIAPPGHRNRLVGATAVVTVAAVFSPALTGRILETGGAAGWDRVMLLNATVCILGAAVAWFVLHPEKATARFRAMAPRPGPSTTGTEG